MNTLVLSDNLNTKLVATFATLQSLGVAEVTFSFSGGGDEGFIDSTDFTPPGDYDVGEIDLDALAESILDEYGYDWVNDEGGWGTVKMLVPQKRFEIDMNIYFRTSDSYPTRGVIRG